MPASDEQSRQYYHAICRWLEYTNSLFEDFKVGINPDPSDVGEQYLYFNPLSTNEISFQNDTHALIECCNSHELSHIVEDIRLFRDWVVGWFCISGYEEISEANIPGCRTDIRIVLPQDTLEAIEGLRSTLNNNLYKSISHTNPSIEPNSIKVLEALCNRHPETLTQDQLSKITELDPKTVRIHLKKLVDLEYAEKTEKNKTIPTHKGAKAIGLELN